MWFFCLWGALVICALDRVFDICGFTGGATSNVNSEPPQKEEPPAPKRVREAVYIYFLDRYDYVYVEYDPKDTRELKVYLTANRIITMVGSSLYYTDEEHSFIHFNASLCVGLHWGITSYNTYDTVKYSVWYDDEYLKKKK